MRRLPAALATAFSFVALASHAHAQFGKAFARISLVSESAHIQPGQPFTVGIVVDHDPGWHSYWVNAGESGLPTEISWKLPEGFSAGPTLWATPHRFVSAGLPSFGYADKTVHLVEITPPAAFSSTEATLSADVTIQTCNDQGCAPPITLTPTLSLPVSNSPPDPAPGADLIQSARSALAKPGDAITLSSTITGDTLTLSAELPEGVSADPEHTFFFPEAPGTTDSALQNPTLSGRTLSLSLKSPSGSWPADLPGILSLGDTAYHINIKTGSSADPSDTSPPAETQPEDPSHADIQEVSYSDELESAALARLADRMETPSFSFSLILLFAFAGGLILNLMPCVFPVLGIKVLGFVQQSGEDKSKIRNHGLIFAAGVLISMWVLVAVLLAVRAALAKSGGSVVWGFQLQQPEFVGFMIAVLFIFGLNLSGLFEIGTSLTSVGGDLQNKKGYSGSFFSGVLTVLVATPCTGPFLGPAFAYAISQPALDAFAVFTSVALGVAFPYVILSLLPKLIQMLPKPGPWMITFKQVMAFLLFGTCIWLILVFTRSTGPSGITWLLSGLLIAAFGCWLFGKYGTIMTPMPKRAITYFFTLASLATLGYAGYRGTLEKPPLTTSGSIAGIETYRFSPHYAELLNKKGRTVWIDFTADW